MSGLIWVHTVFKGYQWTTLAGKELKICCPSILAVYRYENTCGCAEKRPLNRHKLNQSTIKQGDSDSDIIICFSTKI